MTAPTAVLHFNIGQCAPKGPVWTAACLVAADIAALLTSVGVGFLCKHAVHDETAFLGYLRLWPFLFVFPAVYATMGLYSSVAIDSPEELRRTTITSTLLFLALAALTVSFRGAATFFTRSLFVAIAASVTLIPLTRALVRSLFSGARWWGHWAVVFGSAGDARRVVRAIQCEPRLGLKALAVVITGGEAGFEEIEGVPVVTGLEAVYDRLPDNGSAYAVITVSGELQRPVLNALQNAGDKFSRVLLIPNFGEYCSILVNPKRVGGLMGLELPRPVQLMRRSWAKRISDLVLAGTGALILLPVACLIAICIKLQSPGPVLYGQWRIGHGGKRFRAWKFRSMRVDAEQVLESYLQSDAALREEWDRTHKLRFDPRVTSLGRFLRRTSLDELPQLLNVLAGEMSLVGPRPIVDAEVSRYGENFELYKRVPGGVTGLWQVSGRSDTSYAERVSLDTFYIMNWSVWLDLCIIFRTFGVVLRSRGAY
ncbi:MAG TPA: undecaprenyl-phosphate galactose phosphotransferase WbaP [Bryobacteraceae bacterium]|nr:undecaprenyl-phosphate galactose phosphotransferase WbaP [Bryobacteraceae bacterium]